MKKIFIFLTIVATHSSASAQRLSRDYSMGLLTNQVGYLPSSTKTCLVRGTEQRNFEVVDVASGNVVFHGTLTPREGDFGTYGVADFSSVTKEGRYYLRADTIRSYPFRISANVYQPEMDLVLKYFSLQRCGASQSGYLAPCHLDDGIRFDNGKHQDVTGGWHDASDLRKWVSATIYGVVGLARAYSLESSQHRDAILDEIRWGNQYFLKMQEPQGYVMDFVGGDLKKHSDNNRWTDNKIEKGGSDIKLVTPNAGTSNQLMLVSESFDDRVIQTQPVEMVAQYNFIAAEAMVARITAASDPTYSKKCLDAAKKCFDWTVKQNSDSTAGIAGSALQAAVELYKTTKSDTYRQRATEIAALLKTFQATANNDAVTGFFFTTANSHEPHKTIWEGCQGLIGLSDMVQLFPNDKNASTWKAMVRAYAENYMLVLSSKNAFGIVPWGLYRNEDPGGNRKAGEYWYRYFMQPELEWWVGVNSNLASAGVGLLKAAKVLNDKRLAAAAQKQLDWIFGSNPLNSSTMETVGYNHPGHFAGSSFLPNVPVLPGAVVNGLGGDHMDMPMKNDGSWQTAEYWTPMVAYTLWLMAELSAK